MRKFGVDYEFTEFGWNCDDYDKTGRIMPGQVDQLRRFDAVFLGAVGMPGVPDHVSLWGMLIQIRREFFQYVITSRPVAARRAIALANRGPEDIDMMIVRENVEGEYSQIGGRMYEARMKRWPSSRQCSRAGVTGCATRSSWLLPVLRKKVTSATKSNGIIHSMPYWDERFAAMAASYPDIETDQYHIDILTARFVTSPDWFDVVVGSNLFGDILSDPGAGRSRVHRRSRICKYQSRTRLSVDVRARPRLGARYSAAGSLIPSRRYGRRLMLDHFGEREASAAVIGAIENVLADGGPRTPDIGGIAGTAEAGKAIAAAI